MRAGNGMVGADGVGPGRHAGKMRQITMILRGILVLG